MLTAGQLETMFPNLSRHDAALYGPPLRAALAEYAITTPQRIAAWLGQIGHESAGLSRWRESLRYTAERLAQVWPRRFRELDGRTPTADAHRIARLGEEAIAEAVYGHHTLLGKRLGNLQHGDAWRYRGGGPPQLTGRANYRLAAGALGVDLVEHPEQITEPAIGFRVACWFWRTKGCNELADRHSAWAYERITLALNGGLIGHAQRIALWLRACHLVGAPDPAMQEGV